MKNVIIYLIASFTLFACQDEYEVEKPGIPGKATLKVSVNIPEYKIATRAASFENNLSDVWLLTFDMNGLFIERVHANRARQPGNRRRRQRFFQSGSIRRNQDHPCGSQLRQLVFIQ